MGFSFVRIYRHSPQAWRLRRESAPVGVIRQVSQNADAHSCATARAVISRHAYIGVQNQIKLCSTNDLPLTRESPDANRL
jgi:hypothetical protein